MMPLRRLQELAHTAVYEPNRGCESTDDTAPEPLISQARELPARVEGERLFMATDEHGELCALGVMSPGGDMKRIAISLHARIDCPEDIVRRLKVI